MTRFCLLEYSQLFLITGKDDEIDLRNTGAGEELESVGAKKENIQLDIDHVENKVEQEQFGWVGFILTRSIGRCLFFS